MSSSRKLFELGDRWIEKRQTSKYYYCGWYDRKSRQTRRSSLGTEDFERAKVMLAEIVIRESDLDNEKLSDVPLAAILERYYTNHAKYKPSKGIAKLAIQKWSAFFPEATAAELNKDNQKAFYRDLSNRGLSDGYIKRLFTVCQAAFNHAKDNSEIKEVPPFIKIEDSEPRTRILTLEETAQLFNAIKEEHIFMYCMIAFNTVARPAAVLELQPYQIDFDNRLVKLNPADRKQIKKKYRPTIPLTNTLYGWLINPQSEYYVNWKGKKVNSIKTTWRNVRERAGLSKDVNRYTIRHTMASVLRGKQVPSWEVAGILGHRIERVTEIYAPYDPTYLGAATGAIDEFFRELQPLVDRQLIFEKSVQRTNCVPLKTRGKRK